MDEDDLRAVLAVSNRLGEQSSKKKGRIFAAFLFVRLHHIPAYDTVMNALILSKPHCVLVASQTAQTLRLSLGRPRLAGRRRSLQAAPELSIPVSDLLNAALQVIPYLIHPEPLYIPTQLKQALIAQLIPIAQLAVPVFVVHLSIHFNVQHTPTINYRKVQLIFFDRILRNRPDAGVEECCIEQPLPIGHLLGI